MKFDFVGKSQFATISRLPGFDSSSSDMHFFVDNATSVPQYLVCKHATIQFVGLQSETGSKRLKSSKEAVTYGNQEKSSQEKEEKVADSRSQVSVNFTRENSYDGCSSEHPFFLPSQPPGEPFCRPEN
jgi:hypothetical protein